MDVDSGVLFTHMLLEGSILSLCAANRHVLMYELLQPDSNVRESVAEMTLTLSQMQQHAYRSGYAKLPPEYQKRCVVLRQIYYDRVAHIDQWSAIPDEEVSPSQAHYFCMFSQNAWLAYIKSGLEFNPDLAELCDSIITSKRQALDDLVKSFNSNGLDQCAAITERVRQQFDSLNQAINKTHFDPKAYYREIFPTKLCTCLVL